MNRIVAGTARVVGGVGLAGVVACGTPADRGDDAANPVRAETARTVERILVLGTSLTAGQGVGVERAYPAVLQHMIDSAGLNFRVVNEGVNGETSAGGLRRLDWLLRQPVSVLILELGANDGLRGQDVDSMRANLQTIIDRTRDANPDADIVVAGMESPPNMGPAYTRAFRAVFPDLARANDATLVPFLLEGVAGDRTLNQADGIHPTEAGQRIMAETVWEVLEEVLRRRDDRM